MNDWIKWCICKRRILTSGQQRENQPCEICQQEKEHASTLVERMKFNNINKEEK